MPGFARLISHWEADRLELPCRNLPFSCPVASGHATDPKASASSLLVTPGSSPGLWLCWWLLAMRLGAFGVSLPSSDQPKPIECFHWKAETRFYKGRKLPQHHTFLLAPSDQLPNLKHIAIFSLVITEGLLPQFHLRLHHHRYPDVISSLSSRP